MKRAANSPLHLIKVLCVLLLLASLPVQAAEDSERFRKLYEKEWDFRLQEMPLFASSAGVHDYADLLGHVSETDQARRHSYWKGIRAELDSISCERLSRDECINYRIFVRQMDNYIAAYETNVC